MFDGSGGLSVVEAESGVDPDLVLFALPESVSELVDVELSAVEAAREEAADEARRLLAGFQLSLDRALEEAKAAGVQLCLDGLFDEAEAAVARFRDGVPLGVLS